MKRNILYAGFLLFVFLMTGCASRAPSIRNYYILEYFNHTENKNLIRETPYNYSLFVRDTQIPTTYDKRQIVLRHFGPKISYLENDLWGDRLNDIISQLIKKRIIRYNIFTQTQSELLDKRPDLELITKINNIELYDSEFLKEAHLNMDFLLKRNSDNMIITSHSINREEVVLDDQIETFVQQINEIILEETDRFIVKVNQFFSNKTEIADTVSVETNGPPSLFDFDVPEMKGRGLLLLPALSRTDYEPHYKIFNEKGEHAEGVMGKAIPLLAGSYNISFGSGSENQLLTKKNVKIRPMYKTIIEPDWSCLIVDIIDERRNFAQVRYEIFDSDNGNSFGTELTVEKELGEQQKIWVLDPGLYKITINSEPFNTYRDFTTVELKKGKVQKLTIVVNIDDEGNPTNLVGAGILEDVEDFASKDKWKGFSALHGNFNMNRDNEKDRNNPETSITVNTQYDNRIIYENFPFHFTMKSLSEFGITKHTNTDFAISADDIDLKNTFIVFLIKKLGLYTRFDANSHLFPGFVREESEFDFKKYDFNKKLVESGNNVNEITLQNSLFPLILKEGIGINYRVLNSQRSTLNLRTGFGLRQEYNNGVYFFDTIDSTNTKIYREIESVSEQGTELSIIGNFQLPLNLTYSTNADVLFPFDKAKSPSVDWENVFNLRLFKYISIDYKIKLRNIQNENQKEYILDKHSLFLRLTYFFK